LFTWISLDLYGNEVVSLVSDVAVAEDVCVADGGGLQDSLLRLLLLLLLVVTEIPPLVGDNDDV
jgi:hypothetical protein